jgi:hypothetical protein
MPPIPTIPRWSMHAVANWQELYIAEEDGSKHLNLVTSVLINYTMAIGINEITEDNLDEVSCRVLLLEAAYGPTLKMGQRAVFMTRDDVARHVGLRTESEPLELEKFWGRMRSRIRRENSVGPLDCNQGSTALSSLYG